MADETRPEVTPPLSLTDLERFFSAKHVREECPMCGCPDWTVESTGAQTAHLPIRSPENNQPPSFKMRYGPVYTVPAVWMRCSQCAFLRMHALADIIHWLDHNPEESKPCT